MRAMTKKDRVVFLITAFGHGRGGHFYSLKTTVESLKKVIDPTVINIGKKYSPVIQLAKVHSLFVYCNGVNIVSVLRELFSEIEKLEPVAVHAFDVQALLFGRIISHRYKLPLLFTKCGGPNQKGYYPYFSECVVYSNENMDYLKSEIKYKNTKFHLIPNRATKIIPDLNRIELFKSQIHLDKPTFLRIARFGEAYKKSFQQSIDLINKLISNGYDVQLLLVGTVEDKGVYHQIVQYIGENDCIQIFTDDIYTINASGLISVADFVIGTGRGIMEAASLGKIVLTPTANSNYPVLIDKSNFSTFFYTNFSPRNMVDDHLDSNDNYVRLEMILKDQSAFEDESRYSYQVFDEFFNIDNKVSVYQKIYAGVTYQNRLMLRDLVEHFLRTIKKYIFE